MTRTHTLPVKCSAVIRDVDGTLVDDEKKPSERGAPYPFASMTAWTMLAIGAMSPMNSPVRFNDVVPGGSTCHLRLPVLVPYDRSSSFMY
jgi:hypothetical protein